MKKKIAADLTSLAHRILQMKNKEDVTQLQAVAKELYEKLTVLAFTEKHFSDISPTAGSREIENRLEKAYSEAQENVTQVSDQVEKNMETAQEEVEEAFSNKDLSDLFVPAEEDTREEMDLPGISTIQKMVMEMPDEVPSINEEESPASNNFESTDQTHHVVDDTESRENNTTDEAGNVERVESNVNVEPQFEKPISEETPPSIKSSPELEEPVEEPIFERAAPVKDSSSAVEDLMKALEDKKKYMKNDFEEITADFHQLPVFERKVNDNSEKPKSVNDRLNKGLKIGMNDRLGFVKHLFNGSTADFNRVLSQLNTINDAHSAHNFIDTMVKPEYNNWDGKDAYADRFMELVARGYS